jgi:CubicO group peptidase (beta-lactamase class C family)
MTAHHQLQRHAARTAAVLCLLGTLSVSHAQSSATRLRQALDTAVRQGHFMGAVLVVEGDKVLIDRAFGQANLEWQQPNSTHTKFRIGSVTKQFTAAAVLLLEERGALKLADKVSLHLAGLPPVWAELTVQQLLNHTAGIPSFTELPSYAALQLQPLKPAEILAEVSRLPLEFTAGTKFNYSNSGYVLLGQLIEQLSGQSYAEFLRTQIFKPLGMANSSVESNSAVLHSRAAGYRPASEQPGGLARAGYIDMGIPHAAGAIVSTTHDLLRWQQGLYGGKLLSATSLAKMLTPALNGYALGVQVAQPSPEAGRLMYHSGGIEGFSAWLQYQERGQKTMVVLSNVEGERAARLATRLMAAGQPPAPFATLPFFLRGSMNDWSVRDRLQPDGPQRWAIELALPAGAHTFKLASEDWRQIDLGADSDVPAQAQLQAGQAAKLATLGGNLRLNAPQAGRYRFSLDVRVPQAPRLTVLALP